MARILNLSITVVMAAVFLAGFGGTLAWSTVTLCLLALLGLSFGVSSWFKRWQDSQQEMERQLAQAEQSLEKTTKDLSRTERRRERTKQRLDDTRAKLQDREKYFRAEKKRINEEYREKLAEMKEAAKTAASTLFDKSTRGTKAKIVVQEAIRQAKKQLKDNMEQFEDLEAKYGAGTFKGFAVPIDQLDEDLKDLSIQIKEIKEHATQQNAEQPGFTAIVSELLDFIDECWLAAENHKNEWKFSEAYRHASVGLATCTNYALLLTILQKWEERSADDSSADGDFNEPNHYDTLEVDENSTDEEIKKAYHRLRTEWHPDRAEQSDEEQRKEFAEKFRQVQEAYGVLKDKAKKEAYDNRR